MLYRAYMTPPVLLLIESPACNTGLALSEVRHEHRQRRNTYKRIDGPLSQTTWHGVLASGLGHLTNARTQVVAPRVMGLVCQRSPRKEARLAVSESEDLTLVWHEISGLLLQLQRSASRHERGRSMWNMVLSSNAPCLHSSLNVAHAVKQL